VKAALARDALAGNKEPLPASKLVRDLNGPCYAWADLFVGALYAQGIVDKGELSDGTHRKVQVVAIWSRDPKYRFLKIKEGVPGQNTKNPPTVFIDHVLVRIGNVYYDPSYGATYGTDINKGTGYDQATPGNPNALERILRQRCLREYFNERRS
jgi:hypothetical protein